MSGTRGLLPTLLLHRWYRGRPSDYFSHPKIQEKETNRGRIETPRALMRWGVGTECRPQRVSAWGHAPFAENFLNFSS